MMSYHYSTQRPFVFTEEGQVMLLKIRDFAKGTIGIAGAVRSDRLMGSAGSGEAWDMLACIDRLVELGDLNEVPNPLSSAGQHRIFTSYP